MGSEDSKKIGSMRDILGSAPNFKTADDAITYFLQAEAGLRCWKLVQHYAIPFNGVQELFPGTKYITDFEALSQALPGLQTAIKAQFLELFSIPKQMYEEKLKRIQARESEFEKLKWEYAAKEEQLKNEYSAKEQQIAQKEAELAKLEETVRTAETKVTEDHRKALQAMRESEEARKYYESAKSKYDKTEGELRKKLEGMNAFYDALHNLQSGIEGFLKLYPAPKQPEQKQETKAIDDIFSLPDNATLLDLGPIAKRLPKEPPKPTQ